ncbi:SDR family NAD(P)-dependent oxidoreductase [Helicobacter muridarum]|uniref:Oxidoreductase n=1 Tax=Helicobacter muridarum TaxID=216 RepID=A0A377PX02_9HELI|nr:SDR family oxidoreductase [Helicobacter muridarum]STQ87040.1 oxidoreductase [Helicobacter muridarum]
MQDDIFKLKDKLIIITGASSGLGLATCKLLDTLGARVIGIARREDKLQILKRECKKFEYRVYDFCNQEGIGKLFDSIVIDHGKVNGFAYFAGISDITPLRNIDSKKAKKIFDVNFFSALECIKCLYDKRKAANLSIVLISSQALQASIPANSIYDSSKAALTQLSLSISKDLAKHGFRVNAILPGPIRTEIMKGKEDMQELWKSWINSIPLGEGEPSDVANLCAFLLSPLSKWIAAQRIVVGGGVEFR